MKRRLSKSKLLALRQCAKRFWLELHRPALRDETSHTTQSFETGHRVGEIARRLFDPKGKGALIAVDFKNLNSAIAETSSLLKSPQPIFEAGFSSDDLVVFSDILLPTRPQNKEPAWRMIEVKASTSVKNNHRDDAAIQALAVTLANAPVSEIAVAHIDSEWVYPGAENYDGLLTEVDMTEEAFGRAEEVMNWIKEARSIEQSSTEPSIKTGRHCNDPYDCSFFSYCSGKEPKAKYPIDWIPRIQTKALKSFIEEKDIIDFRDLPDELLNDRQRRVKEYTLQGTTFFDQKGAAKSLSENSLPAYFLDFETIAFPVPIWRNTRPYQQIPFQFSVHKLLKNLEVLSESFLDVSGNDPSKEFATALVRAVGKRGPVYVYNAGFETARIKELAARFPALRDPLLAINERVIDLLRTAEHYYYHPDQNGSWSIKSVLPTVAPDLRYDQLDGVQDGGMAMNAYLEAIAENTSVERKEQVRQQLISYCALDTLALVQLWQHFTGRKVNTSNKTAKLNEPATQAKV